tara:strand:- start:9970 stop:12162 length:2193 start_codon:yes stop_codon:yes gene_type:complete
MPALKRTTFDKDHYHIVYILDDGTGTTSPHEEDGHIHDVIFKPEEPSIGEDGLPIPPAEPVEGEIVDEFGDFELLESNGHSHNIIEILHDDVPDPLVDMSDEDLLKEVSTLHRQARAIDKDFINRGNLAVDFYNGKQWDVETATLLKKNKRACVTVNEIKPIVQVLSGHQRQNRTDIKTFPIEDADPRGSEIVNVILKYILDKSNYAQHESKVFMDQVKVGRGCFDVFVSFDKNTEGDINIVRYKWDQIVFGPHMYEDISDLEYLVKTKWYSKAKLSSMYPDKKDELDLDMTNYEKDESSGDSVNINIDGDQYDAKNKILEADYDGSLLVDVQKKSFKLLELWRKRYSEISVLININDTENEFIYEESASLSKEDLKKAGSIQGMEIRKVPNWQMEVIAIAGKTVLDKRVSKLGEFNSIPVYASKDDSYVEGKIEPLIDLQKEINKRTSQAIDIVNTAINDGWLYEEQTFAGKEEEAKFLNDVNTPGWAIKVTDLKNPPVKVERGRFPAELVNMREIASSKMKDLAGITNEVLGQESNAKSGVAIARRLRQGLTVNDYLFDNLSLAKKQLGRVLIKMVQDVYTVDRIEKILHDRNAIEPFQLLDDGEMKDFSEINEKTIRRFLTNVDFTKYDVSISESANSPTRNLDRFMTFTELINSGSLNEITIDLAKQAGIVSPSDAEKYKKMLADQAASEAEAQERDRQAQNERTVLAKGVNPKTGQPYTSEGQPQ